MVEVETEVDPEEIPLVVMGVLMALGGLVLVVGAAGGDTFGLDPIVAAYALFVVAFSLGTAHYFTQGESLGVAAHAAAVIGWAAGIAGRTTNVLVLKVFALVTLAVSGAVLLYLGLDSLEIGDGG